MRVQVDRVLNYIRSQPDDMAKNMALRALHDRNETLFHRVLLDHIEEMAPLVYTPTVGRVCQEFAHRYTMARGMYFSDEDRGHMSAMMYNWPAREVHVVVVTDGSRILGLGDLGANGMGIPIGKLALYCAAGGIAPHRVLPVMLDVGTDNTELLEDPFYIGLQHPRLKGAEFLTMVDELVHALNHRWPGVFIQFEDFSSDKAQIVLDRFRDDFVCFNDDIQGTGAVALAGILSALRVQGRAPAELSELRFLVAGSGSAGLGVTSMLVSGLVAQGLSEEEARARFWICDEHGLLGAERVRSGALTPDQARFARTDDLADGTSLAEVAEKAGGSLRAHALELGGAAVRSFAPRPRVGDC